MVMDPTGTFSANDTLDAITKAANQEAASAYYNAKARNESDAQALAKAKQAFDMAYQTAGLSGYFGPGVGNGTVAGQPTFPNIQWTSGAFGQYYPGGFNTISPGTPTQAAMENMQNYGLSQAGATGVYYDPGQMTYRPGTFVRDQETGGIGQIQSNGRLQMFGDQGDFLRAGGSWDMVNNPDMMRNVSSAEYNLLANDPNYNFSSGGRSPTATLALQQMYGGYGMPKEGQQTLANINQQNQIAQNWANIYGFTPQFDANGQPIGLNGAGGTAGMGGQGQQTLAAQQQYWSQAFQEAQANQKNTQAYLTLLSNLRGPADWAKYQQVLGSTPGGLRDLYGAMMGQYIPGGGATTGVQPEAVSLGSMQQQIQGYGGGGYGQMPSYNYTTRPGAPQTPGGTVPGNMQWYGQQGWGTGETTGASGDFNTQGQWVADRSGQRPSQAGTGTMGWGENWGGPAGRVAGTESGQVWGSGIGVGQQGLTPAQQQQATGNGTNMWGANQPQYNLPAPNQIAPQTWNAMTPSQQQMALGIYESGGWSKDDVEALYKQSLPRYAQNSPTAGTWRLTG